MFFFLCTCIPGLRLLFGWIPPSDSSDARAHGEVRRSALFCPYTLFWQVTTTGSGILSCTKDPAH